MSETIQHLALRVGITYHSPRPKLKHILRQYSALRHILMYFKGTGLPLSRGRSQEGSGGSVSRSTDKGRVVSQGAGLSSKVLSLRIFQ